MQSALQVKADGQCNEDLFSVQSFLKLCTLNMIFAHFKHSNRSLDIALEVQSKQRHIPQILNRILSGGVNSRI